MEKWNDGMMEIRLLPNGLDPNFSFLLWVVGLIFPITHSVNPPKPIIPVFHHSIIPIGAKPLSSIAVVYFFRKSGQKP
jgi:hypothetical protein